MKGDKQMKYEAAISELESIVDKMQEGDMDIDSMVAELKRAQTLIKFCKDKLTKTDAEIQKILAEEKDA